MKYLRFLLFFIGVFISCNVDNTLLDEYKLLYTDIENLYTYGYKSYYNDELNKATFEINDSQGSLLSTENNFDCAITGKGFFKVKLNNDVGYTRNGQFNVNGNGELLISNGYSLYEPIYLPMYFIPDSFRITLGHEIYVSASEEGNTNEINIGQLKTFDIPIDLLEYYQDGIYKLRKEIDKEEITIDNKVHNEFIETSNYNLLVVLLRMNYILSSSNGDTIPNIEFKKGLLKGIIEKIINGNEYNDEQIPWMIETILPFIRYDY